MTNTKSEADKRDDYLHQKLIPAIEKKDKRITVDPMAGCISIALDSDKGIVSGKNVWFFVYATPFWEDSKGIPIAVGNDDGTYADLNDTIPFRLTYNVARDVRNYLVKVNRWIAKHTP